MNDYHDKAHEWAVKFHDRQRRIAAARQGLIDDRQQLVDDLIGILSDGRLSDYATRLKAIVAQYVSHLTLDQSHLGKELRDHADRLYLEYCRSTDELDAEYGIKTSFDDCVEPMPEEPTRTPKP
jgi:hypothetical protein